jgi:thiol-disulfide isomerase/thioredoxin
VGQETAEQAPGDQAEGVTIDEIDLAFVPVPSSAVVRCEVDGESLLIDTARGVVHSVNLIGSTVWQCFDGDVELGVLVDELADAFAAPKEVVAEDVVELTRQLAGAGLLDGIVFPQRQVARPRGLDVGTQLEPFALSDLHGDKVNLADLRGHEVLLVNWSPHCGYCVKIAGELADLQDDLESRDVALVLMTAGDEEANQRLLAEHDLRAPALVRDGADESFEDPFRGMGTPVAYLLDGELAVTAPLALGANAVPALARQAAGRVEKVVARTDVRYLPGASEGMCGAGARSKKPRVWTANATYRIGDYHVGIRTDSAAADAVVAGLLAAYRADDDPSVPANYSLVLGGDGDRKGGRSRAKELCLLLWGNATVVRSRSARRVLLGLANHLAELVPPPELTDATVATTALALVRDGEALLVPGGLTGRLEQLQPRLARSGLQIVDVPRPRVDLVAGALVVPSPLAVDAAVLDALDDGVALGRAELPRVEPGRYPLRAWASWALPEQPEENGASRTYGGATPSRATLVSQMLMQLVVEPPKLPELVDAVAALLDRLTPVVLAPTRADQIAQQLQQQLAG